MAALTFEAPTDCHIGMQTYAAGDPVDTSEWTPREIQRGLIRGLIVATGTASGPPTSVDGGSASLP